MWCSGAWRDGRLADALAFAALERPAALDGPCERDGCDAAETSAWRDGPHGRTYCARCHRAWLTAGRPQAIDGPCDDCGGAQPMGRGWQPGIDGAPLCRSCWSRWHAAGRPSAYPPKRTGPCACCAVERPNKAGRWRRGRTADEPLCSACCTRWREAGRPSELVAAGRGPCACCLGETPLGAGWKRGLTMADGTQE
jgi:hypothetical protein